MDIDHILDGYQHKFQIYRQYVDYSLYFGTQ